MAVILAALPGGHELSSLIARWGEGLVFVVVAAQAFGAPLPGTTALIAAALYAGSSHRLAIAGVIVAAFAGVLVGSAAAYVLGRRGGARLLDRHGHRFGLNAERLAIGRVLMRRYGSRLVFFGRFITGLRNAVAFLAGTSKMPAGRFAAVTFAAALVWSVGNGLAYYLFGNAVLSTGSALNIVLVVLFVVSIVVSGILLRRRAGGIIAAAAQEARAGDPPRDGRPGGARR